MKMNLTLTLDWSGDEKVDFRFWNRSISIRGNKYKDIVSAVSAAKRIAKQLNIQVGAVEYLDSERKKYELYIKGLNKSSILNEVCFSMPTKTTNGDR